MTTIVACRARGQEFELARRASVAGAWNSSPACRAEPTKESP
jgi:hypothetical protein